MPVDEKGAEFLVNVSHDLKTPLNAVIGFTSVLLQDRAQDPEKLHQLQLVYRSAHLLLSRIDALCNFYRMQAGVIKPDPEWLQPDRLAQEVSARFAEEARQKGLELKVNASIAGWFRTCPKLIRFVLEELLSNAVKYTSSGGVTLEVVDLGRTIRISVADTGSGIRAEQLANLETALAGDSWEGLGLGLALVRQAARLMGGRLQLDSTPESGSVFSVELEISEADRQLGQAPPVR